MKIGEAVKAILSGRVSTSTLWLFATDPERIQIAIILGQPEELPERHKHPIDAWSALNEQQRRVVRDRAPRGMDAWIEDAAQRPPMLREPR